MSTNQHCRRGSRINTDWFPIQVPKLLGRYGGMLPQEIFWILTPSSPLSWVSESFRWDIGQFHSPRMQHLSNPFSRFQPGKFFLFKIYLLWDLMKNLTDFRKTVKTGVDPHLHCASKLMNLILIKPVKHCCNVALFFLTPPSTPYIVFVPLQKPHTPSGSWWRVGVWKHPAVEPHSSCAIAGSRHSIWRTNPQGVSLMKTTGGCISDR